MENVVTVIFSVESEAYKAFSELRNKPFGTNYDVAEASLVKHEGNAIKVVDAFDAAEVTSDDTATGMVVGSLVGILGGPLGVLLGASAGALIGGSLDDADAVDSISSLEVTASKLYEGDVAIIALVQEEEPAFDAAFEGYETTIIRHFAVDVMDEVDEARRLEEEFANLAKQELRAERKAEKKAKRAERKASVKGRFDEVKAKHAARKDERKAEFEGHKSEFEESQDIANAEFVSSTKEMLGTK